MLKFKFYHSGQISAHEDVTEVSQARFWELVPGSVVGSLSIQVTSLNLDIHSIFTVVDYRLYAACTFAGGLVSFVSSKIVGGGGFWYSIPWRDATPYHNVKIL